jgi:hypothetical protein
MAIVDATPDVRPIPLFSDITKLLIKWTITGDASGGNVKAKLPSSCIEYKKYYRIDELYFTTNDIVADNNPYITIKYWKECQDINIPIKIIKYDNGTKMGSPADKTRQFVRLGMPEKQPSDLPELSIVWTPNTNTKTYEVYMVLIKTAA